MQLFAQADLEETISTLATDTVAIAALALFVFTILAVILNKQSSEKLKSIFKLPLFIGMSASMVLSTIILISSTVYLNVNSDSGGPVHWHAGIEYWVCGTELNLRDPIGVLSNKVGSATYHEHNDKYIHLEGVVVDKEYDASLEKFMTVTGGYITDGSIGIPISDEEAAWPVTGDQLDGDQVRFEDGASFSDITNNGERLAYTEDGPVLRLQNGDGCGPNGEPAELQVFLHKFDKDTDTYSQQKLADPGEYVMRDESSLGPPSDCVIVEFDTPKAATDKLCEQYGIKDAEHCVSYGVSEFNPDLCNIREVNKPVESPVSPDVNTDEEANVQGDTTQTTEPLCIELDENGECNDMIIPTETETTQ